MPSVLAACRFTTGPAQPRSRNTQQRAGAPWIITYGTKRQGSTATINSRSKNRTQLITAATLYPLFVGAASPTQAAAVAHSVAQHLLAQGGIAASAVNTGQQWDSPNGWAPLQWIAVQGLTSYGQTALAATIACRWMHGVDRVYRDSGKLVEKYDVVDAGRRGGGGEYPTQDGFGWTNGVMRRFIALYPEAANDPTADCGATATPADPKEK